MKKNKVDFEKLAKDYCCKRNIYGREMKEVLEDMEKNLRITEGSVVVDLGCGAGRFLTPLAKRNTKAKFIGVDNSEQMLSTLKLSLINNSLNNVEVIKQNLMEELPFEDESVDAVILYHVLHAVNSWNRLLGEARRILKRGGRILIASTAHTQLQNTWNYKFFPGLLEWELGRTPDVLEIMKAAKDDRLQLFKVKEVCWTKKFNNLNDWVEFLRLRPISALSGIEEESFEKSLTEMKKYISDNMGEFSLEYGFDYHTQMFFEKL